MHAVVLTGGSAFGLAAADGAVQWLEDAGVGYETAVGPVPIVPAAVVFDLGTGDPRVPPGVREGLAACAAAVEGPVPTGRVGAGTGATVGKWAGVEFSSPGGIGVGRAQAEGLEVRALAVVNAVGDVVAPDGSVLAGTTAPEPRFHRSGRPAPEFPTNTVLGVVALHATLDKREVRWIASRAADGITVSVRPAHTRYDGDVVFAVAAPPEAPQSPSLDVLGHLATTALASAVRNAVSRESGDQVG